MNKSLLALVLALGVASTCIAKTYYVSADRPNNNGAGTSWKTAKKTIQAAVNLAKKGDTIIVDDGKYEGFATKNF